MKQTSKRFFALFLAMTLCLSLAGSSQAAEADSAWKSAAENSAIAEQAEPEVIDEVLPVPENSSGEALTESTEEVSEEETVSIAVESVNEAAATDGSAEETAATDGSAEETATAEGSAPAEAEESSAEQAEETGTATAEPESAAETVPAAEESSAEFSEKETVSESAEDESAEKTVSEEAASEETVSEETASEKAASVETASEETAAEDLSAEKTQAETGKPGAEQAAEAEEAAEEEGTDSDGEAEEPETGISVASVEEVMPAANDGTKSGSCGDNLTWTLDEDGTLTISGTGKMEDYATYGDRLTHISSRPWSSGSIVKIVIKSGVTSVGSGAFYGCESLTSVTIGGTVTSIGVYAFHGCTKLTGITIPAGVTSIGEDAFGDCENLEKVIFEGDRSQISISDYAFNHTLWQKNIDSYQYSVNSDGKTATITRYVDATSDAGGAITIPSFLDGYTVTAIGDEAFSYYKTSAYTLTLPELAITSVTIPDSVTSIGYQAFYGNERLTSVSIPDSVTSIGDSAFTTCGLTSVTIPDSVTFIGDYAFSNCDSLTSVSISGSVTSVGEYAFSNCDSLTSITVNAGNSYYSSLDGVLFSKGYATLLQYPGGKSGKYTVPEGVASIGEGAFGDCSNLTGVFIGSSVTAIGDYAFEFCTGLTSVTISGSVASVGDSAFRYCSNLTSVSIGSSVKTIGTYAFASCTSLTGITIPKNVTVIGSGAFISCPDSLIISGYSGSAAETYAKANSITFKSLDASAALSAPEISSVANVSGGIRVKWKKVSGAAKYRIYYKGGSVKNWTKLTDTASASYTFTKAASGTTYTFTVQCVSSDGQALTSSYDTAGKSIRYLSAGKISSLTNTASGIKVKWKKVSGASGYYIYRKTSGGSYKKIKTIKSGSTVSCTDTSVKSGNGTAYTYAVVPYSGSSRGAYTGKVTVRLAGTSVSGVKNVSGKKLKVTWKKDSKVTGYQIQYSTSGKFTASTTKMVTVKKNSTLSKTISGLKNGKTYYVRIRTYKKVSGKNYYSAWTKYSKSVKIKK